jgi:hypothetical protein
MKHNAGLIILVLTVLSFLFFLSRGKNVPLLPADALHAVVNANDGCLGCHGPGKQAPLKPSHPPKEQCLVCHKTGKS